MIMITENSWKKNKIKNKRIQGGFFFSFLLFSSGQRGADHHGDDYDHRKQQKKKSGLICTFWLCFWGSIPRLSVAKRPCPKLYKLKEAFVKLAKPLVSCDQSIAITR